MISDTITQKIGEALKAHDEVRLSTLRMLSSALNYEKIAKQRELTHEEEIIVVRREVKKRKDAIEMYEKASDQDKYKANEKIKNEKEELEILNNYLPLDLSQEEVEKIVDESITETGAADIKDIGKVISLSKEKAGGRADGATLASMVKSKLSG